VTTQGDKGNPRVLPLRGVTSDDQVYVDAFQRLVSEVFRLNGELLAAGERLGKDLGVSPARWQALATIRNQPLTVADIARRLGLTRQSVQRTVNNLRRDGLVRTQPNPEHRRSHLIQLTPSGELAWAQLRERQTPLTGMFTHGLGLTAQELDRIAAQLRAIRKTAEDIGHDDS
jgi:DNA-binding MarR family transcriptional regulator